MSKRLTLILTVLLGLSHSPDSAQEPARGEALRKLLAVYATAPQDYPKGKEYARPDLSVPFRWHFYHDGAVERFESARMVAHVEPYNPLEDGGVLTDKSSAVKWQFTTEHATEGKRAVQVTFPAAALAEGKAVVRVQGIAGEAYFSEYLRARNLMGPACVYGPHYRWVKLDVFNPAKTDVPVRFCGVPLVLHPGANIAAVKTADAVDRHYSGAFNSLPLEVVRGDTDVTLYLDNARMEQEAPSVISKKGRMFQFPGRADPKDAPVLWPGFTPVLVDTMYTPKLGFGWTQPASTRTNGGHSFRSYENGILWGSCRRVDSPFRIDLPAGRYGVHVFAAPSSAQVWAKGATAKLNGQEQVLIEPRPESEVRQLALGGETWDFRPGACVWEALVRPSYYPPTRVMYQEVKDGQLLIELPPTLAVHALTIFPEADKDEALKELGRFNFLMAESWDVSHPWVKGQYAARANDGKPYIAAHEEMIHPERIEKKLAALKLTDADFQRGFVPFQRGLTEAVYPDSIPTPRAVAARELRCFATPGEFECVTLGLLPLAEVRGLRIAVTDLLSKNGKIPERKIDVRVSRQHQKTMQFGHHNHDYNYQEHYLIVRPTVDLYPGAARRVYFDIAVPASAAAGEYVGEVRIASSSGKALATVPLTLEVLPIALQTPPVWFASSMAHPRLKEYGFNAFHTSYDDAVKHGYGAYVANLGHGAVPFKGKGIGWSSFAANKDLLEPILSAPGPRGYFGGPAPNTHSNPKAAEVSQQFFDGIRKEFHRIELLGRTFPAFHFRDGKNLFQTPHEWIVLAAPATRDEPEALEAARKSGKEFWYIDGLRHSKEQAARFTFGFWLWRLGATGRFTTLQAHLQYGGGTARESYSWEPYFTLLDVTTCNVDTALKESLVEGRLNPCRDLVLLREGIDDYRYLHTLESLLKRAEAKQPGDPAVAAARKFRDQLHAGLSLDLTKYYLGRSGAYGENWYALPDNPWTPEKFTQARRQAAEHIVALRKLGKE